MAGQGSEGKIVADRASAALDPYELLGALQARNVSFVVIGAFARVTHGTRELTEGIDITPSMRDENLTRLERALEDLVAQPAEREQGGVRGSEVIELETRAGNLKIVPEPAGTRGYDDLRRRGKREPLGRGLRPQIASADDLARMLGALSRSEDVERLRRLRRLMRLERQLGRDLGRGREIDF